MENEILFVVSLLSVLLAKYQPGMRQGNGETQIGKEDGNETFGTEKDSAYFADGFGSGFCLVLFCQRL